MTARRPPRSASTTDQHPGRVDIDLESPRRDAIGDYLLGGSINSTVDRTLAVELVAAHPQLPQLATTAASWDRDAAQLMLEQGIGLFLILGTGGFPLWASHSTLASLHAAQARVMVLEHDPVTQYLHNLIDGGAAVDRALVVYVPAEQHHVLPQLPEVAELLASDAPIGILATGLLRPARITLSTILSLLTAAPPASLLALTQLTTGHRDDGIAERDNHSALFAAHFAKAGIPIAVEDRLAADQLLADYAHVTAGAEALGALNRDETTSVLLTALLARRQPRPAAAELRPGAAPIGDTHEQGHAGGC